jgi:membrane protein
VACSVAATSPGPCRGVLTHYAASVATERLEGVGRRIGRLVERMRQRPVVGTAIIGVERFLEHLGFQAAAATAYQSFLSLFPLLILSVSFASWALDEEQRHRLAQQITDFFALAPDGTKAVSEALSAVSKQSLSVGLIGAALLAWTGTSAIGQVRTAVERAFDVERSDPLGIRGRARDLLLLPVFALLILLAAATAAVHSISVEIAQRIGRHSSLLGWLANLAESAAGPVLLFVLCFLSLLIAYTVLPRSRPPTRDRVVGALLAGAALVGLLLGYAAVLNRSARLGAIYGSLASTAILLILLQFGAAVLFAGAEMAQARFIRRTTP